MEQGIGYSIAFVAVSHDWSEISRNGNLQITTTDAEDILLNEQFGEGLSSLCAHFERRGYFRFDKMWNILEEFDDCDEDNAALFVGVFEGDNLLPDDMSPNVIMTRKMVLETGLKATVEITAEYLGRWHYSKPRDYPDLPTLFDHLQTPHAAKCTVQFGFKAGREKLPLAGEDLFGWAKRIAISKEERERQLRLLDRVGHDFELYDLVDRPKDEEIQFIVPGLIPRGMVGLLAGGKEVGKSSLMDELCAKLECNIPGVTPEFLGVPLACGMTTLFLSGEDPGGIFSGRRSILAKTWGEGSGMIIDATTRSFDELLALIRRLPKIDLIVLDPARRFIDGDEDSSSNVSVFFQKLVSLSQEKNCAIIVVQHSKKDHRPRSLKDVSVRGSGVFLDRPRFVVGMFLNADGSTSIGLLKHNMPPNVPMWERGKARFFRLNLEILSHEPIGLPQDSPRMEEPAPADDDHVREGVFEAVARLNAQGEVVQQTGKRELFQLNLPSLAGLSRATLRSATAKLVQIGRLELGPTGLVANPIKTQYLITVISKLL